jgi:hypothetical protein
MSGEPLEVRFPGVIDQELAHKGRSFFQDEFDRLCRLKQSDLSRDNSQDAGFVSAGDQPRRRRFGKEAAEAGPALFWKEDADLAFKLKDSAEDVRLSCKKTGVVDQVFCREVVRPIHNDIIIFEDTDRIFGRQPLPVSEDLDAGIDTGDGLLR